MVTVMIGRLIVAVKHPRREGRFQAKPAAAKRTCQQHTKPKIALFSCGRYTELPSHRFITFSYPNLQKKKKKKTRKRRAGAGESSHTSWWG